MSSGSSRSVYVTGGVAAATAAGIGLAIIVTVTIVGWVAAPHDAFGEEIVDLLQSAVLAWLVGHHVSFGMVDGQISLLPLGLVLLPGLLLYQSGRWLVRLCEIARLRHVYRAALAMAGPYAAIAGTLALMARTETIEPSMPRALVMGFVVAFLAGGWGVLRQLMRDKGVTLRHLFDLMPARSRSLLVGVLASLSSLMLGGLLLFLIALGAGFSDVVAITGELSPGVVGGVLLLVLQLAYLPNAVVFVVCYALGPGFALGEMTVVAPTGVSVGALPSLPMLAAVPENGAAPAVSLVALALPLLAGAVGGGLTQRSTQDMVAEVAPLWGLVCGVTTGIVCAALAELAGGSLGSGRLTEIGPSTWQVGLVAVLELGVGAAVAAWGANWWYSRATRRAGKERRAEEGTKSRAGERAQQRTDPSSKASAGRGMATVIPLRSRAEAERTVESKGRLARAEHRAERKRARQAEKSDRTVEKWARKETRRELRAQRQTERRASARWWRRGRGREAEEVMYGITYEAPTTTADPPDQG